MFSINHHDLAKAIGADESDDICFFVNIPNSMSYYIVFQKGEHCMVSPYDNTKPVRLRYFVERYPFWCAEFSNFEALANSWENIFKSDNPLALIKRENLATIIDDIEPDYNVADML